MTINTARFVKCTKCGKTKDVIDGKLPKIGWCGCENAEQECHYEKPSTPINIHEDVNIARFM